MVRVGVLAIVLGLVAVSCGGGDSGDVDAFCTLVEGGAGDLSNGLVDTTSLDQLLAVAPEDVRPAVEKLRNLARNFGDIDPTALDQLFAAAFDSDAQSARQQFEDYVASECGVENATSGGAADLDTDALAQELEAFIHDRFGDADWIDKVHYQITVAPPEPWAVQVVFDESGSSDEAVEACSRVSVWLYDVKQQPGSIAVTGDGLAAARAGPQGECSTGP